MMLFKTQRVCSYEYNTDQKVVHREFLSCSGLLYNTDQDQNLIWYMGSLLGCLGCTEKDIRRAGKALCSGSQDSLEKGVSKGTLRTSPTIQEKESSLEK